LKLILELILQHGFVDLLEVDFVGELQFLLFQTEFIVEKISVAVERTYLISTHIHRDYVHFVLETLIISEHERLLGGDKIITSLRHEETKPRRTSLGLGWLLGDSLLVIYRQVPFIIFRKIFRVLHFEHMHRASARGADQEA